MKILLAVDGSPCSDLAVKEVAGRPWPADTVVHVVTVDAPIEPALFRSSPTAYDEFVKQKRADTVSRLNAEADELRRRAPGLTVKSKLLEGSTKDAIVAEAEQLAVDLVVVGSHGYGPLRRFFLGSVSQYIANNAPCSVLIVRCRPDNCPVPRSAAG